MNEFNVLTEVDNSFLRLFIHKAVWVVYVPECGNGTAVDAVKHTAKTFCVSVYTVCFNKYFNCGFFRNGSDLFQSGNDSFIVHFSVGSRFKVSKYTDIRRTKLVCKVDIFCYLLQIVLKLVSKFHAAARRKARYFKMKIVELSDSFRKLFICKRFCVGSENIIAKTSYLNAVKA